MKQTNEWLRKSITFALADEYLCYVRDSRIIVHLNLHPNADEWNIKIYERAWKIYSWDIFGEFNDKKQINKICYIKISAETIY